MRYLLGMKCRSKRNEIETEDYGGEEFKQEIENLIADIDTETRLTKFKMRAKGT